MSQAIDAAVKALQQGSVSNGDVTRAKEQLKVAVLNELESGSRLVSDIAAQAVLLGQVHSASQIVAAIDSVTAADVNAVSVVRPSCVCHLMFGDVIFFQFHSQAAKKVACGKWSIGAVGNLANVPHVNQLN